MLKVINNKIESITLDGLYTHAINLGMRIQIESNYLLNDFTQVELKCKNKNGSSFSFIGRASNINEAFLNAFKEAEIIGVKL